MTQSTNTEEPQLNTDHRDYTYPQDVLRDRIILITGASDGIGHVLALHAAKLGAQVICTDAMLPNLRRCMTRSRPLMVQRDRQLR